MGPQRRLMRSIWAVVGAVLLAGVFLPETAMAGEIEAEPLDLPKARGLALAHHPLLQGGEAASEAAWALVGAARSAFLPRLDLQEGFLRSDNPVRVFGTKLGQGSFTSEDFAIARLNKPDPLSNWQTQLILTQPVFNQGEEILGYRLSKVRGHMADLGRCRQRQAVLLDVEQAYYRVLSAIEAHSVLKKVLAVSEANLRLAEQRFESGGGLKSDVLAAQVQLAARHREESRARNAILVAMAALNRTMGFGQDRRWDLVPASDACDAGRKGLDWWIETALAHRPEVRLSGRAVDVARLEARKAKFRFWPSVNLQGLYEANARDLGGRSGESWTVMATVSINIFAGLGDRARLAAAEARERQAEAESRDLEGQVILEVREAYFDLETAREQIEVTARTAAMADEALRIMRRRYENGLALMVELLSGEAALMEAALQQAQAGFDAQLAMARLNWSAGVLGEEGPY